MFLAVLFIIARNCHFIFELNFTILETYWSLLAVILILVFPYLYPKAEAVVLEVSVINSGLNHEWEVFWDTGIWFRKLLPLLLSWEFFSSSTNVSCITLWYVIHFWVDFCSAWEIGIQFHSSISSYTAPFVRGCLFFLFMFWQHWG